MLMTYCDTICWIHKILTREEKSIKYMLSNREYLWWGICAQINFSSDEIPATSSWQPCASFCTPEKRKETMLIKLSAKVLSYLDASSCSISDRWVEIYCLVFFFLLQFLNLLLYKLLAVVTIKTRNTTLICIHRQNTHTFISRGRTGNYTQRITVATCCEWASSSLYGLYT